MPPPTTTTTTTTTAAPGPWICTPLVAGPLCSNSYCTTISGLAPNTCYEYRSVFVVDGTCYCGNILGGTTQPTPVAVPNGITTGNAFNVFATGYYITGASATCDGGTPITEWGHLYTSNPSYNSVSTLTYENLPTNVKKSYSTGSHSAPPTYFYSGGLTSGLPTGAVTWFRAYAKNAAGVGYGAIKSQTTTSPIDVTLCRSLCVGANGTCSTTRAYNVQTPPLMTAGESYCLCMEFPLGMASALFGSGSYTSVGINCNGNPICFACITNQACCIPSILCTMNCGDSITVSQWTRATSLGMGGLNACVCIRSVTPISGSFQVSTTCCKDCAYTG